MRRDRIADTIAHRPTDVTPHQVELTSEIAAKLAEALDIATEDLDEWVGNHCAKVSYNIGGRTVGEELFADEFGVVWDRTGADKDIGVVQSYHLPEPSLSGYEFPEPDLEAVRRTTEAALSQERDRFTFGKIGMTYFERAWSLCGMENLLVYFALEPDFVDALFARILEYNVRIIDVATQYDLDGFYFGDDYGQQTGLIMSPDMWRRFIKPGLAEMFSRVKDRGMVVALHSCGNIEALLPDLIEIGLDVYQTLQPEVYDLARVKRDYGRRLTFWGGISTQRTLPFETPAEIVRTTKSTIEILGDGGGYIAGPTHRIPGDVPVANVVALVEALRNQNGASATRRSAP